MCEDILDYQLNLFEDYNKKIRKLYLKNIIKKIRKLYLKIIKKSENFI